MTRNFEEADWWPVQKLNYEELCQRNGIFKKPQCFVGQSRGAIELIPQIRAQRRPLPNSKLESQKTYLNSLFSTFFKCRLADAILNN